MTTFIFLLQVNFRMNERNEKSKKICLGLQFLRSANCRILEVLVPKFAYDFIRSIFWLNLLFSFVEILSSILNYFVGKIFDKVDIRKALVFDSAFDSAVLVLFPYAKSKIFVSSLVIARKVFSPLKIGLKTIYTKLGFSSSKDLTYFSYTRSLGRTIASLSIFFLLFLISYKLVFYISAALLITSIFLIAKLPNVNLKIKKSKIKLKTRKVLKKKWKYIAISSLQNFHYGLLYFPAIIIFMTEVLHFSLQFVYLIYGLGTLFALPFFKIELQKKPFVTNFTSNGIFYIALPFTSLHQRIWCIFVHDFVDFDFNSLLSLLWFDKQFVH